MLFHPDSPTPGPRDVTLASEPPPASSTGTEKKLAEDVIWERHHQSPNFLVLGASVFDIR